MNHWYGFRIRKAFASKENWYAINHYGAKQLILGSIVLILTGIIFLFVPIDPALRGIPMVVIVLIVIVRTVLYARKLPG